MAGPLDTTLTCSCGNGQIVVMRSETERRLFLECLECVTGWWTPDLTGPAFRTEDMHGKVIHATLEEVREAGWAAVL